MIFWSSFVIQFQTGKKVLDRKKNVNWGIKIENRVICGKKLNG